MHEIRSQIETGVKPELVVRKARSESRATGLANIPIARAESRRVNQRREDRHLNLVDRATIIFRRKAYEVGVINVSSHGVMIHADIEPRVGEKIEIRFEDCNRTLSYVRWLRGSRIGLEFSEETVLIAPANVRELIVSGRREGEQPPAIKITAERPPRSNLMLRGLLHCGLGSLEVKVRNISAKGAMIHCEQDLVVGSPVVIELAGTGGVAEEARVRWCRSGQIGLLFDRNFDMRLLADGHDVVRTPSRPGYVKPDYLATEGSEDCHWVTRTQGLRHEDL
jgi:hypothetical protein